MRNVVSHSLAQAEYTVAVAIDGVDALKVACGPTISS